jgi:hypothetical protein
LNAATTSRRSRKGPRLRDDADAIVRSVIAGAKCGDIVASKIILDRMAPVRKGAPVRLGLPNVKTACRRKRDCGHADQRGWLYPDGGIVIAGP